MVCRTTTRNRLPQARSTLTLAQRPQLLLQRLVEHPRLQAHEGLPQVRLLPDSLGDRRPADGGVPRPGRGLHGRAEEEVVILAPARPVTEHLSKGPVSKTGIRPRRALYIQSSLNELDNLLIENDDDSKHV